MLSVPKDDSLPLPVTETQASYYCTSQPIASEGNDEPAGSLLENLFGQVHN